MTTRKEALIALRDKVREGERGDKLNTISVFPDLEQAMNAADAFDGSTDAALALCEAVLPGWGWEVNRKSARVASPDHKVFYGQNWKREMNAGALFLLAILEALIAEEE